MIFVGYELGTKGYRFWDISTRLIVVACDATFDESSFPRRDTGDRAPDVPVHAKTPSAAPEPTSDSDPNDLFPDNHGPPDQSDFPPRNDDPQQDNSDDDDLYGDLPPPPKEHFPPQRDDPNEPRFVMGPPPPPKHWSEYRLPNPARNSPQDQEDRRRARDWVEERYRQPPPEPVPVPDAPRPRRQNAGQRRVPDNVYGDVPPTEAWRQQDKEIRRDRREEESARIPQPAPSPHGTVPSQDGSSREDVQVPMDQDAPDSHMDHDYPDAPMDSARWIQQHIQHASSSEPLTYREAMSRPDAKQWEIAMHEELKSQEENET